MSDKLNVDYLQNNTNIKTKNTLHTKVMIAKITSFILLAKISSSTAQWTTDYCGMHLHDTWVYKIIFIN